VGDCEIDQADNKHRPQLAPYEHELAPRKSTACANETKCGVELIVFIRYCSQTGILSIGVLLPEGSCMTISTGIAKSPNCSMVVASLPRRMPSAATTSA